MFRVQDIEAITETEFITLADIPNPDTSLNSFFKVTFEVQIDPNAENARSAILLIDDGRKDQFSRNGALTTTSCLSDDNTSTLARGISGTVLKKVRKTNHNLSKIVFQGFIKKHPKSHSRSNYRIGCRNQMQFQF